MHKLIRKYISRLNFNCALTRRHRSLVKIRWPLNLLHSELTALPPESIGAARFFPPRLTNPPLFSSSSPHSHPRSTDKRATRIEIQSERNIPPRATYIINPSINTVPLLNRTLKSLFLSLFTSFPTFWVFHLIFLFPISNLRLSYVMSLWLDNEGREGAGTSQSDLARIHARVNSFALLPRFFLPFAFFFVWQTRKIVHRYSIRSSPFILIIIKFRNSLQPQKNHFK